MAGKAAAMGSPRLIVFGRGALCAAEALSPGAAVGRELVALRRVLRRVWAGHSPRLGSLLSRVSVPVYVCTHTLSLGSSRWHPPDRSALGRGVYMCVCRYDVCVCRCVVCVWCMGVLEAGRVPRPYAPPTVSRPSRGPVHSYFDSPVPYHASTGSFPRRCATHARLMQEKASQRIFFSFQLHPRPQHPPSSMVELLHHKRASQGRATSSVDQPCH